MKKITILLTVFSLISILFATTMTVYTITGTQEFELSEITNITFSASGPPPTEMAFVEGSTFQMGDRFSEGNDDELPLHDVSISDFYMSRKEVTQAEYESLMGENPASGNGIGENNPVFSVNFYDATDYCNALSIQEGLTPCYSGSEVDIVCDWNANGYRLPTEAEWEYAARGGISQMDNLRYSGCLNEEELIYYGWYTENSNSQTQQTGTKLANQLGFYDMSGNVAEWCWDLYDADYYSNSPSVDPTGPETGSFRMLRGGSWISPSVACRIADRTHTAPYYRNLYNGFRLVRVIQ